MKKYILLLLLLFALPLASYGEVKTIEVKHHSAEELVSKVQPLLDEGEKVEAAGSHLVLIAAGESLKAAEKMIALLDVAQRNLLIRVRQSEQQQRAGNDSAAVHYGSGGAGEGKSVVHLGNSSKIIEQSLQLVEGGRGLIEVGREVPFTKQWAAVTGENSGYSEKIDYKTVATGFWVAPAKIIGDQVLLDVEPYVGDLTQEGKSAPQINFSRLRTRLQVPMGQWYPLGSQLQHRNQISQAIVSWSSNDGQADRRLEIRIDPVD